ncbi:conserved hypothetical protein [Dehalogenimonas lykanthroporepellens BL-DC-9]|nr:conserved hypothetical protein [Dehalogenimonas lykanthroporepellens BL-DC-9]
MERIPIEELKDRAGYDLSVLTFDIEKGLAGRFTAAVGDENPLWLEQAPPSMIPALGFDSIYEILSSADDVAVLHGATDVEFHNPVMIGDTITMVARIASTRERRTSRGLTVFVNFDIAYTNQRGDAVASCRQTALVNRDG